MTEENLKRLREVYAEWAQGNFRAGGDLWAPDLVFDSVLETRATVVGPEAAETYMREFLEQWDEFSIAAERFEDLGETILVTEKQRGTGKTSRAVAELTAYAAWTFRGSEVTHVHWNTSRGSALEAARQRGERGK